MTMAFMDHLQSFSYSALIVLVVAAGVIVIAICRNYYVKTGMRLGWFSFFLETERRGRESPRTTKEAAQIR